MPKPASNIAITGSGKTSRPTKTKAKPDNATALRAWRIRLIEATWRRVTTRQMETAQ